MPVVWLHRDEGSRGRLPRGRRRGQRHGVHRCADRPLRRARRTRRPSPRGRWPLARRLPLRPAAPVVDLLRRRVDACSAVGASSSAGPRRGCTSAPASPTICAYYDDLLADRMLGSGRVELFAGCEYLGDRTFVSRVSGERFEVPRTMPGRRRALPRPRHPGGDAAEVRGRRRCAGDPGQRPRAASQEAPSQYVVVGSGKTATDACIWLLARGVDPDAICWVRPRDPWMLNRALIQPDPVIYLGMVADMMQAAGAAASMPDLFLRLEDAGIMLRIDRSVTPTMAKAPTLGTWELELLRSIEQRRAPGPHRHGEARPDRPRATGRSPSRTTPSVVNCAADGLKMPPLVPIWGPEAITLQPIRAGFPCFGAALAGYVEATRDDDAREEPALPAVVVRQHPDRLGTDERPGPAELGVVRLRARHQGVVRPGRAQPRTRPTRARRVARAGRRPGPTPGLCGTGACPAGRAERRGARLSGAWSPATDASWAGRAPGRRSPRTSGASGPRAPRPSSRTARSRPTSRAGRCASPAGSGRSWPPTRGRRAPSTAGGSAPTTRAASCSAAVSAPFWSRITGRPGGRAS